MTKLITTEGKEVQSTDSIQDLTQSLIDTFDELRLGTISNSTAKANAQVAGAIISSLKTKILYDNLHGDIANIKFLEYKTV